MTEAVQGGFALPFPRVTPVSTDEPSVMRDRIKLFSASGMFGRGLLLIVGEMAQLIFAFAFMLLAIACCVALALKVEAATHFMGVDFVPPRGVVAALGSLMAWSPTGLVLGLLAAIFGIKLLDLVVRVLRRRAQLAEIGYPAFHSTLEDRGAEAAYVVTPAMVRRSDARAAGKSPPEKEIEQQDRSAQTIVVQRSREDADEQAPERSNIFRLFRGRPSQ